MTRKIILAFSVLLVAVVATLFLSSPAEAEPSIKWNPKKVEETLQPGQSRVIETSFTALSDVPSAVLRVATSVAPYVTVHPTSLGPVSKGQTVPVTLTVSVPIDALPATTSGAVQLRVAEPHGKKEFGKAIARPLPVDVCVEWPKIVLGDIALSYPPTLEARTSPEFRVIQLFVASDVPSAPRAQITVENEDNPNNFSLAEFFDGDPGADLSSEISSGSFSEAAVNGRPAYRFVLPDVPAVVVIVLGTGNFTSVTDVGMAFQLTGEFQQVLNGLEGG